MCYTATWRAVQQIKATAELLGRYLLSNLPCSLRKQSEDSTSGLPRALPLVFLLCSATELHRTYTTACNAS